MLRIPPIEIDPDTGWSGWQHTGFKFRTICCDCGLAHDDQYKIVDGELQWRTRVNKRATATARRASKKKLKRLK